MVNFEYRSWFGRWGTSLRPDLVLKYHNDILILHITNTFENSLKVLAEAKQRKIDKYVDLARRMSIDGSPVKVEAILVGCLGSWDPNNDKIIKRLYP